ncbi:MAG TPA: DUF2804 domain-containing protein [Myxococcales bacterium]
MVLPSLPKAPDHLFALGAPQEGLFAGAVLESSFRDAKPPFVLGAMERRLVEKKWQYLFVADREVMLTLAILDAGYLSAGVCSVFDRGSCRLLADEGPVLPPLFASVGEMPGDASLRGPRISARIEKNGDRYAVRATWAHCEIDLILDGALAPPPASAVAALVNPGRFDYTQKSALLRASGSVRSGNVTFELSGAPAGLDYSHGFFEHETAWRWAFAAGPGVAFNFSDGFLQGQGENVAWLEGEPRPVGPVTFEFDKLAPLQPWRIRGESVDLTFKPEGVRTKSVDLKFVSSRYVQPFGTFEGRVLGAAVEGLAGLTEDHVARW